MKNKIELQMPRDLYDSLQELATEQNVTLIELLRRAIKWELVIYSIRRDGGSILYKDKDGEIKEIKPS
jgi:hypothetical protein